MGNEQPIKSKSEIVSSISGSSRQLDIVKSKSDKVNSFKNRSNSNCMNCFTPFISTNEVNIEEQEEVTILNLSNNHLTVSDKNINASGKSSETNNVQININNYYAQEDNVNNDNKVYREEDSIFTNNPLDKSYFNLHKKSKFQNTEIEHSINSSNTNLINVKLNSIDSTFNKKSCFKKKERNKYKENLHINFSESLVKTVERVDNFFKVNTISISGVIPNDDLSIGKKQKNSINSLSKNRNNYIHGKVLSESITLKPSLTQCGIINKDEYLSRFIKRKKTGVKTIETDEIQSPVRF